MHYIVSPAEGPIASLKEQGYVPVLDGRSRVLAAAHADHDDREEEEETSHREAHAVNRLVTHDDVTVHLAFYPRYGSASPVHTEPWNLTQVRGHCENKGTGM